MTMNIRSQIPPESESSPAAPTPSAVPVPVQPTPEKPALDEPDQTPQGHDDRNDRGHDRETPKFPHPKLRLEIRDLDHPGASKFLGAVNAATLLSDAVKNVQRLLYRSAADKHTSCPPTRSVTVILRDMGGVAYTTGVRTMTIFFELLS